MDEKEFQKKFEEWKENYRRTSLVIARIPEKTKTEFMKWCEEDLCKDYGMGIKWLLDYYKGTLPNQNEEINEKIEILADEINKLKEKIAKLTQKPKEKEIVMADGKIKRIGGEQDERKQT